MRHAHSPGAHRARRAGLVTAAATVALAVVMTALLNLTGGVAIAATLFSDNFNSGSATGWSKSGGDWSVVTDGTGTFQQGKVDSELARQFAGSTSWTDYTVTARVKPTGFSGSGRYAALGARSTGSSTRYQLALLNSGRAELQAVNGSSVTVIGGVNLTVSTGTWYTLQLTASGSTLTGWVNGNQVASGSNSQFGAGRIVLVTSYATARFDDVVVSDAAGPAPTTGGPQPSASASPRPPSASPSVPSSPQPPAGGLVGWATVNGSTSGGAGGSTVNVTSASQFLSEINSSGTKTITFSGTFSISGMNKVASNKTILGVGSNATLVGGGLTLSNVSNVIIRNINFRDWDDDAINVETSSHHVWIDHNSLSNGYDGAIDIKRGSDYITVSWNRIFNHDKSMLLGHSDDNGSQDIGHLRVTYHHNWFDGSGTRHPRVRFGNPVHVYNNYYRGNEYGVASTCGAGVLVEGNYFEDVDEPTAVGYADSPVGAIVQRNNYFVGSGSPASGGGSVNSIPYSYTLQAASSIKSIVTSGAGTGRI
ncbi:family 16 glycoside hydrolase [Catellatospora chokoriensis]|uniref:Pectate lyase domain-containing protein n=1 Tax=Catellatospora chokoriensis TaxID=310353 RepID=A0A8J3JX69_9ACTN|nr:family 16 glycoside hydrolase [Catellatospora chokoriensis]GIF88477.1 hypothetical protein Cch02nite_19210 [Catellatospora chokoriensis]